MAFVGPLKPAESRGQRFKPLPLRRFSHSATLARCIATRLQDLALRSKSPFLFPVSDIRNPVSLHSLLLPGKSPVGLRDFDPFAVEGLLARTLGFLTLHFFGGEIFLLRDFLHHYSAVFIFGFNGALDVFAEFTRGLVSDLQKTFTRFADKAVVFQDLDFPHAIAETCLHILSSSRLCGRDPLLHRGVGMLIDIDPHVEISLYWIDLQRLFRAEVNCRPVRATSERDECDANDCALQRRAKPRRCSANRSGLAG